jgi:hypothetical protein
MAISFQYGGVNWCKDVTSGYYQGFLPTGRRTRLHRFVFEREVGPIPAGMFVHHIDGDKENNAPDNLALMTQSEHAAHHAALWTDEHLEVMRRVVVECAQPAAKAWHGSKAGREWHRQHAMKHSKVFESVERVCEYCGREYTAKNAITANRFCSNACKSAWRRASGIDDEDRVCTVCGATFRANKYATRQTCSADCHAKLLRRRKH